MKNPFVDVDARFGLEPLPTGDAPIFLLAAGWRSGSTLLQRLVASSGEVLVWGEPYGRASVVPALTRIMQTFQPNWPVDAAIAGPDVPLEQLTERWVANYYPEPAALRAGLRSMMDQWLAVPADRRGYGRFGLKEVRFAVFDAMLLQWLYPDARFVFLVRNPWDAWSSMKGHRWVLRWPDQVVNRCDQFVKVWAGIWQSFLAWDDPSVMRIRYEELANPEGDLRGLADHLRLSHIATDVRATQLRGIRKEPWPLDDQEVELIDRICGPLARPLGYTAQSSSESQLTPTL